MTYFARLFRVLALVLCASMAMPALAQAPAPNPELAEAVTALRAISTLRADFTQTDANGARVSGVLTIKRPGRIRFQYAPGTPMVIVSDGRALTVIDTQYNKIQRWPIADSPLGALLDPARDVTRFGRVVPTGSSNLIGIEVRDRKHAEYGTLTLVFQRRSGAPGGLELSAWTSMDAQNRRTFIRLTGHQYGVGVDDALFRYRDPNAGPHH